MFRAELRRKGVKEDFGFCGRCFSPAAFVARKGAKGRKNAKDIL
jgi:hypothetical protein